MDKTRLDSLRAKVEELKAFDIALELRMINTEATTGVPDVVSVDMVAEKLMPGFVAITSALEGLLAVVEGLESETTGDYLLERIMDEEECRSLHPSYFMDPERF